MSTDANPSYFPSMPPTFGWRRVVELADEFKVSAADMLKICDRLGVSVEDASEWLDAETVDHMRDVIKVNGPAALLKGDALSPPKEVSRKQEAPRKAKREAARKEKEDARRKAEDEPAQREEAARKEKEDARRSAEEEGSGREDA